MSEAVELSQTTGLVAEPDDYTTALEEVLAASDAGRWREVVRRLHALDTRWPPPRFWLTRLWHRWWYGAHFREVEAGREAWLEEAQQVLRAAVVGVLERLEATPDEGGALLEIENLVADLGLARAEADVQRVNTRVAAWQGKVAAYQKALEAGERALGLWRYREAAAKFLEAEQLFAGADVNQRVRVAQAGLASERAFEVMLARGEAALTAQKPLTARALAGRAAGILPRDEAIQLIKCAGTEVEIRDAAVLAMIAARAGAWARAERAFGAVEALMGPDHPGWITLRLQQASLAMLRQLPERAVAYMEGLSDGRADVRRGVVWAHLGHYEKAHACLAGAGEAALATRVQAFAARRAWEVLSQLHQSVAAKNWEEAERVAVAALEGGESAEVRAALEQTIRPARARLLWDAATPAGRVARTLAELRQALSPGTLHNWFVAVDEARAADTAYVEDWLRATSAVLANIETSPAFESLHRAWQPSDRDTVREQLRARVEAFLDGAREQAPASEPGWRDVWRVEMAGWELQGASLVWPRQGGMHVTPGLWLTLGAPAAVTPATGDTGLKSQAFTALYSTWAAPIGAWLGRDSERLAQFKDLPAQGQGPAAARTFALAVVAIDGAIQALARQEDAAWQPLLTHRALVRQHTLWVEEIDRLAAAWFEEAEGDAETRLLKAWHEVTASAQAKTWQVNRQVEEIVNLLAKEKMKDDVALKKLEAILKEAPGHALAQDLLRRVHLHQALERIETELRRDNVAAAVNIAMQQGSVEIREKLAQVLLEILKDGAQHMSQWQLQQWVRWLHQLCPHDPLCQELWRRYG